MTETKRYVKWVPTEEGERQLLEGMHPFGVERVAVPMTEEEIAEYEAEEKAMKERRAAEKAKKEAAKQRKIERDLAQGITPEMRKAMTYARRYEREIAECERKIADLKREITVFKGKKAHWEKVAKGE